MQNLLRRHLLALMLGVTGLSYTASAVLIDAPAFARNGADDGPNHDSGDDHGGRSHDSDDSDDDDNDDDSRSGSDDDDSNDDNSSNKANVKATKSSKDGNKTRPTATITLTDESLAKVRAGTHVVVDQLGRQLEIRVLTVNGQQVIRAKPHGGDARRNPGPIDTINVVPVSTPGGSVNDDGTPDQGRGDK